VIIKAKYTLRIGGKIVPSGQTVEVPENAGRSMIECGVAQATKPSFETRKGRK
jgi:hypothetical protein